jgi:hypothetical protein
MTIEDWEERLPPKPVPGERLIKHDAPDWQNNAWLKGWAPWHACGEGFRKGARRLVEFVDTTGTDQDYLVYPIVFSYRHYLEIKLKELILLASDLLDEEEPKKLFDTHDLCNLWTWCRSLLQRLPLDGTAGPQERQAITEMIDEISKVDPGSYSFRYPVDKKGEPSLPADLVYLNLGHFSNQVERVASCLEGCTTGIDYYLEGKRESEQMNREMAAEYEAEMRAEHEAEMREYYSDFAGRGS